MKYLLIKYIIVGAVYITHVSDTYIVKYVENEGNLKLLEIVDRKHSSSYAFLNQPVKATDPNTHGKAWSAVGIENKVLSVNKKFYVEGIGECLRIESSQVSSNSLGQGNVHLTKVSIYLPTDNALIKKYCHIQGKVDWRILQNNINNDVEAYPYLYYSYFEDNEDPEDIIKQDLFKIIDLKEQIYTEKELEVIHNLINQF